MGTGNFCAPVQCVLCSPNQSVMTALMLTWCCIMQVDDALQLFAQHGLNAAPKLFHAIPAAPAAQEAEEAASYSRTASSKRRTEACPYDLQVVPRCQLPACYCTVTATGVVQVGR